MHKKQSIIEAKLPSKPSFKNILNIEEAKLPSNSRSKSKSISQKSISHKKISTVPNKSPRKMPPRSQTGSSNNVSLGYQSQLSSRMDGDGHGNNPMPYQSEYSSQKVSIKQPRYDEIASEFNRSRTSKSPKKDPYKQAMRQVVLLKNRTVQIQQSLHASYEDAANSGLFPSSLLQKQNQRNPQNSSAYSASPAPMYAQLKILEKNLDTHFSTLQQNCAKMEQGYNNQFAQLMRNQSEMESDGAINAALDRVRGRDRGPERVGFGMAGLQGRLAGLEKLFRG